nr:hypothetical protein GCM10017611_13330 [Rhodococcus wratislaviensis]
MSYARNPRVASGFRDSSAERQPTSAHRSTHQLRTATPTWGSLSPPPSRSRSVLCGEISAAGEYVSSIVERRRPQPGHNVTTHPDQTEDAATLRACATIIPALGAAEDIGDDRGRNVGVRSDQDWDWPRRDCSRNEVLLQSSRPSAVENRMEHAPSRRSHLRRKSAD